MHVHETLPILTRPFDNLPESLNFFGRGMSLDLFQPISDSLEQGWSFSL
jgi:hypothetical protein